MLESGEEISYDMLVLAVGSTGPFPAKYDDSLTSTDAVNLCEQMLKKVYISSLVQVNFMRIAIIVPRSSRFWR